MNQKYIAIAAVVFIAWFSWFFRYDLSSSERGVTLDRWTGSLIFAGKYKADLSKAGQPAREASP